MKNYTASDGSTWTIENTSPPIPIRSMDWAWTSTEYDGPGDYRYGNEASEALAIGAIEDLVSEREDD